MEKSWNIFHVLLSRLSWPVLLAVCLVITGYGFSHGHPILFFNLSYFLLILSLFGLERIIPFEKKWFVSDGQLWADIGHTLSSKGTVQTLLVFAGVIGLADLITSVEEVGYGIWPREWPMALQVILGLYVSEFMLYWAHRWGHEWPILWRFHAIHHSSRRLWIVNTGRFHFVDSLVSIVMGMSILVVMGAPMEIVQWMSAITAFIGMLTHCNVDMRFGPISWVMNTPGLHRWHHSRVESETNRNYCENVMLWDQVFGTYMNPDRRPPSNIGIRDYISPSFKRQIVWPFISKVQKKKFQREELLPSVSK